MLHELQVAEEATGERLDVYLESRLEGCSRSLVAKCIKSGLCTVTPGKIKPAYRLRGGEQIAIEVPELEQPSFEPEAMDLVVLYEDEDCLILNKPSGLVVHPAVGHPRGTLLNGLLHYTAGEWTPSLVHRLDADTSGVIAVAKHTSALDFFQKAFKERDVQKTYLALVAGSPKADLAQTDAWLGRHPKDFRKRAVLPAEASGAKSAQTTFVVRERHEGYAVWEARPRTGRTHQIRVHAAHLGHPILADRVYGRSDRWPLNPGQSPSIHRQALHAWRLRLPMPNGDYKVFDAEIPDDLQSWLAAGLVPMDRATN